MSEFDYVQRCQSALQAAGFCASDRQSPSGVWVVFGKDKEGLPFFAGRPEGRDASWRQACLLNNVPPPLSDSGEDDKG